ncbi:hypothetical protein GCM10009710_36750 [Aeromicrobium alkaliterrae]|uniref:HTH cro/C1-type domain-containing protein n=1 Tax=Aeromicrobium alkaliterrae TaxID=302168 RepID=A0ABP4WFS4_9ACTN
MWSEQQIKKQISLELKHAAVKAGNQLRAGEVMGYSSPGSFSKLLKGTTRLKVERAELMDEFLEPHGGTQGPHSLVDLAALLHRRPEPKATDVMLASPMSAAGDDYEGDQKLAMKLVNELRRKNHTVYYAGERLKRPSKFDAYDVAYKENVDHIMNSRVFVLYLPRDIAEAVGPPSSVWIELGMALARGIPVTIFAPESTVLPYVVRRAVSDEASPSRHVLDVRYFDDPKKPAAWIRTHGDTVINGLSRR